MGYFMNQYRPRLHLTLQEAASRFNVSPQQLSQGIRIGKLRSKRVMHRSWVTAGAVAAYVETLRGHIHAPWNTTNTGGSSSTGAQSSSF